MTAPMLDTSWLRSNPAAAFEDSVPKSFSDLLGAHVSYRMLYEDWLAEHHQRVLPGFTKPEIDVIYSRIGDPRHERTDADKAFAEYFSASYRGFEIVVDAMRKDMKTKAAAAVAAGTATDKKQARKDAGMALATASLGKALSAAAGDDPVKATLAGWAQVQAFKEQMRGAYATTLTGFKNDKWAGAEQNRAVAMLEEAWSRLQSAEGVFRAAVIAVEADKENNPALRAGLEQGLATWASAVSEVSSTVARAAGQVSVWAQKNASRLMGSEFNANFKVLGGIFEASHILVGTFGVVAGFFPQLAPVSAGISVADDLVDLIGKRVIVAFASRGKAAQVKLAGVKFEVSDDFKKSAAGKFWVRKEKLKEDVKKTVGRGLEKVTAAPAAITQAVADRANQTTAVRVAKEKAQHMRVAVHDKLMTLRAGLVAQRADLDANSVFNQIFDSLDRNFGTLVEAERDEPDDEVLDRIQSNGLALLKLLHVVGEDVPESLKDTLTTGFCEVCKEIAPTAAAIVGNAISKALPFVNIAVFAVNTGLNVLNYWADVNKVRVPDNMTPEELTQFQAFVAQHVYGANPLFHGVNLTNVTIFSIDNEKAVCEIAGVKGVLTRDTLRFSPDDRSTMQAAVLARVRKEHPVGINHEYRTLLPTWDALTWGEEEHGVMAATVTATVKGSQQEHTLTLAVHADGMVTVSALTPELPPADLVAAQASVAPAGEITLGASFSMGGVTFDMFNKTVGSNS
jgi:hypothetical protein